MVVIEGWAYDKKNGNVYNNLYIKMGNGVYSTKTLLRPDVAKAFNNGKLEKAGFFAAIKLDPNDRNIKSFSIIAIRNDGRYEEKVVTLDS